MKKQKRALDMSFLDANIKGKKGKKRHSEKAANFDIDYEYDGYDADEWEDSFDNYKYQ